MAELSTIFESIAGKIAGSVNAKLSQQLSESAAKMHTPSSTAAGPKSAKVSPVAPLSAQPEGKSEQPDIRGLFDKLLKSRDTSKQSGKTWLESFVQAVDPVSRPKPEVREADSTTRTRPRRQPESPIEPKRRPRRQPDDAPRVRKPKEIDRPEPQKQTIWQKMLMPFVNQQKAESRRKNDERQTQRRRTTESRRSSPIEPLKRLLNETGGGNQQSATPSRLRSDSVPPPQNIFNRMLAWVGQNQTKKDQSRYGADWLKPGFGNGRDGTQKRSGVARAARLTTKANKRVDVAIRKRNALGSKIGTQQYDSVGHKQAISQVKAAQERLGQATQLDAKATLTGAGASTKVAEALGGLRIGLVGLASRLYLPAAIAGFALKAPWMLRDMAAARIESLKKGGEYENQGIALATAKSEKVNANIEALNARDTAASTNWLVDQLNDVRRNLRPIGVAATVATNTVLGGALWGVNRLAQTAGELDNIRQANWELFREKGFNYTKQDVDKRLEEITDSRLKQQQADMKVFNKSGSLTAGGWVTAMQKLKDDARKNNRPRKPLPPLR